MFDSLRACWNKQLHRKQSDFFRIWINSWVAVQWAPFSPFGSSTGIFQKKVPLNLYFQDHLTWQGLPLIWIISPWSATRCCSPFGFWPNNQSPEKSAFSEHPHASSLSTHKKKEPLRCSIIYARISTEHSKFTVPTSKLTIIAGWTSKSSASIGGWREHNNGTKNGSCKKKKHWEWLMKRDWMAG